MPRCAWSHSYEWTESYKCIYACLTKCKNKFIMKLISWDIANLFSITMGTSDHIYLKWLKKFVTSMDP